MTTLEIAVTSVEEAVNAAAGGADSIELSYDLSVGGLTPKHDMIEAVREAVSIPMWVILRPHAESFMYMEAQIDLMLAHIRVMQEIGVDGVVFGAVDETNAIDVALVKQIAEVAKPLPVTLHRALDGSHEPEKALKALVGIVPRVLTSGPAETAWEGRDSLKLWVEQFGQDYIFVGAGSLTQDQLADYIQWVEPNGIHLGSAAKIKGVVDADKVRQLKELITQYSV
ncbi:MAG: copper homeostasis protein CutC [Anaerolineae bacterium]|nr:copper homeostasis protein CutC [Anaerolineae bacterium]